MISIGGGQEANFATFQDPWAKGLGIFDMTTLSWTNAYDAAAPAYERPSLVSQFYANNSRYPIGWGDPELERIFTTPNGTATGNSSSNSNTSSSNSSGHNSTGTETTINRTADTDVSGEIDVVGGIIGGSAALTIIALLIYWRLCRYKRREKPSQNPVELPG
jgi:hypothetical protein